MKTKNFAPNFENEKKGFFFIGLSFALAATLAAFEWRTSYKPCTELPGLKTEENIFIEEPPIRIVPQKKEKPEIAKIKKVSSQIQVNAPFEITEIVEKTDVKTDFNPDEINPVDFPEETFIDERDNLFIPVENMPQFPGGETELFKFLKLNVKYPKMSKELGITGTVYVEFIVNTDGTITDIKVAKSVSSDIDKEALRVVSLMPLWIPGSQRNHPVQVGLRLPIKFTLM